MPYTIRSERSGQRDYEFLLAYVEDLQSGYVSYCGFAYHVPDKRPTFDFVDLRNIDELVGAIVTRGRTFWVNQMSCFWPQQGYGYVENTDRSDVFLKGRGLRRHRQPGQGAESEEESGSE